MNADTINLVSNMLTSIGFPIICCYFLYNYIQKKDQQLKDITESHQSETLAMTNALNANTAILERLVDKIENLENRN